MIRRAGNFFLVDPNGGDRRIMRMVEKVWNPVKAQEEQASCLDQVVTQIRGIVASGGDALSLKVF